MMRHSDRLIECRSRLLGLVSLVGFVLLVSFVQANGKFFPLPFVSLDRVWEAEEAEQRGKWEQVYHPWASGGSYVKPKEVEPETALEFPFQTDRPITLQVRPVWWRHGERKSAKRFPYPLSWLPGPDVLDWYDKFVFFTAPATGRIGIFDAESEKVMKVLELGGYLSDIVIDRNSGKIYVADALGSRIVVLDAKKQVQISEIPVPKGPWSLAFHGSKLYVVCREGKSLVMIDGLTEKVEKTLEFDISPLHVEIVGKERLAIVVWPEPKVFDMLTLEELPHDEEQYPPVTRRVSVQFDKKKTVDSPKPHILRIRQDSKTTTIEVNSVTGGPKTAKHFEAPLKDNPGPDVMDIYGRFLFFTSPATGKVGVVDMDKEVLVKGIDVGGYLTDLVADSRQGKIYVSDAMGNRVVVLDAKIQSIIGEIKVPECPWFLTLVYDVRLQRTSLEPPIPINKLFVACRKGKAVVAIDVAQDRVIKETSLSGEPLVVKAIPLPNEEWWPLLADDKIPIALQPRVAVELNPLAFEPLTLRPIAVEKVPERFTRRNKVGVKLISETAKAASSSSGVSQRSVRPVYCAPRISPKVDGDLTDWGRVIGVHLPGSGKDLGGQFYLGWDENSLYFAASVADDIFHQPFADNLIWEADCIQIAMDILRSDSYDREYGFALSPVGPFTYCWYGPETDASKIDLAVKRRRDGLNYEAAIPWEVLSPLEPAPGKSFGFSMVVMDSDGAGWEGCLEWTPGIVNVKNPSAFGVVMLVSEQTKEAMRQAMEKLAHERTKNFLASNNLVLGVDNKWVDVSSVTDPQGFLHSHPLSSGDLPGTISFSMDGGPEHNWMHDIWMRPDNEIFLVGETEEFWRWNAPTFSVSPGNHILRVRAYSPFAHLDGLKVSRSLKDQVAVKILPEPREVHGEVRLPSYQGVFYYNEPVRFRVEIRSQLKKPQKVRLTYKVTNYLDQVEERGRRYLSLQPGKVSMEWLDLNPQEMGRFVLTLVLDSSDGTMVTEQRFLRLPKLEHPRLLFRKEEIPEIKARIQKYPKLFQRFLFWLRRKCQREEKYFPERFLPPGLTRKKLGEAAPLNITDTYQREQWYGWRMYELAWRMLACQFASMFLEPVGEKILGPKVAPLLKEERLDGYCQFHHHGPFFPGADAALFDLAAMDSEEGQKRLEKLSTQHLGNMDMFPWFLVALEEPLTPQKRALIYQIMTWRSNCDRYFETHCGSRGGIWWLNPWTGCHCPLHGHFLAALYCRNLFGEKRLFEKKFFTGFQTFHRYVDPRRDDRKLLPVTNGPQGEPLSWIETCLLKFPLEKRDYGWDDWVKKLEGELKEPEEEEVDKLFDLEGMPIKGPLRGGVDHFVTGVSVPIALALGWYEPGAPKVTWEDLPPTTLFDVEGWAMMRSGWDKEATEVSFISGVRDHTCRHQPNHFTINKAGQFLVGTPSLFADDGNCTPAWGNVVVEGKDWVTGWRRNLTHPRDGEYQLINRFSPSTWQYIARNRRLTGFAPAEGGWGGGVNLHGHTESIFTKEAEIVAYETWPEFDYVAGDATNAWLPNQVSEMYRQLVFLKPDIVVIYDRIKLGPEGKETCWLAATGPGLSTQGNSFLIKSGSFVLHGKAVLPENPILAAPKPLEGFLWKDQKLLEIRPGTPSKEVEYLIVMNVGKEGTRALEPRLISERDLIGTEFSFDGGKARLLFRRTGALGGRITITGGARDIDKEFVQKVEDTYWHWSSDERFEKWMIEPRFQFVVPEQDRKKFASGG